MPMPLSAASVCGTTRTGPTLAGNRFTLPDVRLGGHFRTSTLATTRSALAAWVVPNTPWLEKLNVRSRVIAVHHRFGEQVGSLGRLGGHGHGLNSPAVNLSPLLSFAVKGDANTLILGSDG